MATPAAVHMTVTTTTGQPATIEVRLDAATFEAELRRDAAAGLATRPRWLAPTWLHDERGCQLFEAITEVPEYYPTRTERGILAAHAAEIARVSGADTLVELGSGTSEKTRLLLDALSATGQLRRFVPFDVAEPTLRAAAGSIARAYAGVEVTASSAASVVTSRDPHRRTAAVRAARRHHRELRAARAARVPRRAHVDDAWR